MDFIPHFLLSKKVRKLSEIVYNEWETKNDIAKERRWVLRHDVVYVIVCFGSMGLHYLTIEKKMYFRSYPERMIFLYRSNSAVFL